MYKISRNIAFIATPVAVVVKLITTTCIKYKFACTLYFNKPR